MNNISSVGVIVITYNGENYILKQLKSIKDQSLVPSCVLVFDDCSTDNTLDIVKNFIKEYELQNWKIIHREENVGWRKNAYMALMECNTDIVFWSDQDDVWCENKIEVLLDVIEKQNCLVAYSCWEYINSDGERMNLRAGSHSGNLIVVNPFMKKTHIPPLLGCSACFKRVVISKLPLIMPCEYDSPDWVLYLLGVTLGKVVYVDKPLFFRRLHESNVTSSAKKFRRSWTFSYSQKLEKNAILVGQYNMLNKILGALGSINVDTSFITAERDYLYYRTRFLNFHDNGINYLISSMKQNNFFDFIYTLYSDITFVIINVYRKIFFS